VKANRVAKIRQSSLQLKGFSQMTSRFQGWLEIAEQAAHESCVLKFNFEHHLNQAYAFPVTDSSRHTPDL
jgi:hypothetical protein